MDPDDAFLIWTEQGAQPVLVEAFMLDAGPAIRLTQDATITITLDQAVSLVEAVCQAAEWSDAAHDYTEGLEQII